MKYNAAQLLLEPAGSTREYEIDQPPYEIDPGVRSSAPLTGKVKLTRTNRGILADVRAATELTQECSRCLDDVVLPVGVRFVEEFYPTVDLRTGMAVQRPEGGSGFMMTEAHEVDVTEAIRQSVLLELPMKPLCRVDCAGLCIHCGNNLNEGPCGCPEEPADHRLSALADWLKSEQLN
jgi:uncharacterized protein